MEWSHFLFPDALVPARRGDGSYPRAPARPILQKIGVSRSLSTSEEFVATQRHTVLELTPARRTAALAFFAKDHGDPVLRDAARAPLIYGKDVDYAATEPARRATLDRMRFECEGQRWPGEQR